MREERFVLRMRGGLKELVMASVLLPTFLPPMLSLFALESSSDSILAPRRKTVSSVFSAAVTVFAGRLAAGTLSSRACACPEYSAVLRTWSMGRKVKVLRPHLVKQSFDEKGLQPSVGKYGFAAENFVPYHSAIGLFGSRGPQTKADDLIACLSSDLVRYKRLEK